MADDEGQKGKTGREPQLNAGGRRTGSEPLLGGPGGVQQWLDALKSGDNRAIWRSGRGLVRQGEAAFPRLIEATRHEDYRVRAVAAWALGRLAALDAAPQAVVPLGRLVEDASREVRLVALHALRGIRAAHPATKPAVDGYEKAYMARSARERAGG